MKKNKDWKWEGNHQKEERIGSKTERYYLKKKNRLKYKEERDK